MRLNRFIHATLAALILVSALAVAGTANAQLLPGVGTPDTGEASDSTGNGAASESAPADTPSEDTGSSEAVLQDLIDVLRDDEARQTLLTELENAVRAQETAAAANGDGADAAGDGEGAGESAADGEGGEGSQAAADGETAEGETAEGEEEAETVGGQVSDAVVEATATAAEAFDYMMTLIGNLPSRLEALDFSQLNVVIDTLIDVLLLVIITYGVLIGGNLALRRLREFTRRRTEKYGPHIRYFFGALMLMAGAAVVLIATGVGTLALIVFAEGSEFEIRPTGYLQAFLRVELFLIATRLLLMPTMPWARLLHFEDRPARGLHRNLRILSMWLGYGLLLVVPSLSEADTYIAGHALTLVMAVIALIYGFILVITYRKPIAEMFMAVPNGGEPSGFRQFFARLWYLPVIVWLVASIMTVVTRPVFAVNRYFEASLMVALVILGAFVVVGLAGRFLSRGVPMTDNLTERLPELQRRMNAGVPRALVIIRAVVLVGVVGFTLSRFGLVDILGFFGSPFGSRVIDAVLGVGIVLGVAFLIWLAIEAWVDFRLNPRSGKTPTARERTLLALLRNGGVVTLVAVSVMFVLSELGVNIAPLLASAGVVGLAIGFGAQKLVQDVITGIFIQLEGAIDVGDVVTVGGTSGVVERLTIRSVSLRDLQGVYHIVPFSSVDMVSNYMRGFAYVLSEMGVAYRENVDEAKRAIFDAFERLKEDPDIRPNILDEELEWMGLDQFGASEIVLRSRIKTLPGKQWETGRAFNAEIKKVFDERDIEIPFPHQTVYFGVDKKGEAPPMHVVNDEAQPESAKSGSTKSRPAKSTSSRRSPAKSSSAKTGTSRKRTGTAKRGSSTSNMPDND